MRCHRTHMLSKILWLGETFVSLRDEGCPWKKGIDQTRRLRGPYGFSGRKGGNLTVVERPLKGRGLVISVNRHNRMAIVELHVDEMMIMATVGLATIPEMIGLFFM